MSGHSKSARARADAEFEKTQSEARARMKEKGERDSRARAVDEKTARLKLQRLERDRVGPKEAAVKKVET